MTQGLDSPFKGTQIVLGQDSSPEWTLHTASLVLTLSLYFVGKREGIIGRNHWTSSAGTRKHPSAARAWSELARQEIRLEAEMKLQEAEPSALIGRLGSGMAWWRWAGWRCWEQGEGSKLDYWVGQ